MPVQGDIRADGLLTNLSVALADQTPNLIGRRVAPLVLMDKDSGPYPFFGRDEFKVTGEDDDLIGDLGEAKTYEPSMTKDTYTTEAHAEKVVISVAQQHKSQTPFEVAIAPRLAEVVRRQLMRHEIKVSALLQAPGNFAADNQVDITASPNRQWDESAPTPLIDIETGIAQVELSIGRPPTHLILPRLVYNQFRSIPAVRDAIKGDGGGAISREDIARYFGLEEVLVGGGVYDSAKKGQAASRTRIWGLKHATLLYVTPSPEPKTATTAYTFVWNPPEGGVDGRIVTQWFMPELGTMGANAARAAWYHDVKAVGVDSPSGGLIISGYLIKNLIT